MPGGPGTDASYGDIPDDIILAKQERTNLVEDPEMLDYYQRNLLRDTSPDAPYMESDIARRGGFDPRTGELRQGASDSRAKLALRHIGKRSYNEPNLPDGTFLDWQGLEPDPRSIRPDPDFQEHNRQTKFRGRYVNYYSDADNSVPETGMNTYQRWQATREPQNWTADRMKWFDTAKDNRTTRRTGQSIPNEHRKVQVTVDGEIINLSDALTTNKSNLTDLLTNQYKVGWRRTTDQNFDVAKYGQIRPTMNMGDQAWYKSLRQGQDDRVEQGVFQDQAVPKLLVQVMENIIRGRAIRQKLTEGMPWRSEYNLKNYKDPIKAANYRGGTVGYQTVEDRATEIVRQLQDAYVQRKDAVASLPDQPNSHVNMSWINPQLVQFMELSNRKIGPMDVKMIIKDAAKLSRNLGDYLTNEEMSVYVPALPSSYEPVKANWNANDNRHKEESLVAPNYLNINPITPQPLQIMTDGEDYKSRSDYSLNFSMKPPPNEPHTLVGGWVSQDQDFALDRERRGAISGPMGGKYNRRHTVPTHWENMENTTHGKPINDADNRNLRYYK